jgi:hypothetical protein
MTSSNTSFLWTETADLHGLTDAPLNGLGSMPTQPPLPPNLPPMQPDFSPVPDMGVPAGPADTSIVPHMGVPPVPTDTSTLPPVIPIVNPISTPTPGLDVVLDQAGDTDLYCGANQDLLFFEDGSGFDLVFNFDASDTGDTIVIDQNINGNDFWSVDQLAVSDTEYGALVDLGGGNGFLLAGVSSAQLDALDFAIQPSPDFATQPPPPDSEAFFF